MQQSRSESPTVRASHRAEFTSNKRSISIKQFLYDWAPPAYDHPCLWRNAKISKTTDTPLPQPELIGNNYLWYGLNYRRQKAATLNMLRTQIELTILKGEFDNQEISKIFASLTPINADIKNKILQTSFAELTHTYRHQSATIAVPISYFKHQREQQHQNYAYSLAEITKDLLTTIDLTKLQITDYTLDSVFLFGENQNSIHEVEYYFESTKEAGNYIRILTTKEDSKYAISYPAIICDQESNFVTQKLDNGHRIYHAWSKKLDYGCHSLIFKHNNIIFNYIIKPAPWTTIDWVKNLCLI